MFYPIALKILRDGCTGAKKLATGKFYYFVNGIRIENDGNIYASPRIEDDIFNPKNEERKVKLSFSAIVGANGSGKSTLVELMIRMCNNFGASVLGEHSALQNEPHLHFIDGLYAELYYRLDSQHEMEFYRLSIQGRNVELVRFSQSDGKFIQDLTPIYDNQESVDPNFDALVPLDGYKPFPHELAIEDIANDFFYTYVSNYSTYAYNPKDFPKENTPIEYERKCRKSGSIPLKPEDCHWLEGLFQHNMHYQEPLMLYPYRVNGNIDVNVENMMAYLRFLAVLIYPNSNFNVINGHIEAIGFQLTVNPDLKYDDSYIRKQADYRFSKSGYAKLRKSIISIWGEYIDEDLNTKAEERNHGTLALNYLVYKTLKISSEFPKFASYFHEDYGRARSKFDEGRLRVFVRRLANESSLVTREIKLTLIYLIYGLYDLQKGYTYIPLIKVRKDCNDVKKELMKRVSMNKKKHDVLKINGMEDLTPPPFFQSEVMLEDIFSHARIDFCSLSSGERQIIYSVTGILYPLLNIDSISSGGVDNIIGYSNINVILEEIEQYFHPDMQRRLVKFLIDSIRQCSFQHLEAINIILITHSPFVLSDIPARNVLALTKDGMPLDEKEVIRSFGANIHDILHHPFFLKDGAVGEFANRFIKNLGIDIAAISTDKVIDKDYDFNRLESLIDLIDEPILKRILWEELYRRTNSETVRLRLIDLQIEELQRQRRELDNRSL